MRKRLVAVLFAAFCPILLAQHVMNNAEIIKLVKAGLSEELILSTINGSPGTFDTSADGLIALKSAGVTDKIVAAMVLKSSGVGPAPATATTGAQAIPTAGAVPPPPPPPLFHSTDGKVRVYVTDHPIFESQGIAMASGNRHGASAGAASHTQAGDDPRTVEVQADIQKLCPAYVVASNNQDRADYVLIFRRRGGERSSMFAMGGLTGLALSAAAKVDGASLFENNGDMVFATKQNTVEKSIKDICAHIPVPGGVPAAVPAAPLPVPAPPAAPAAQGQQ